MSNTNNNTRIEYRYHYPINEYRDDVDTANVVIMHKLYVGYRYVIDNGRIIDKTKIGKWGPYGYKCPKCGFNRKTYEAILKHIEGCKKVMDRSIGHG